MAGCVDYPVSDTSQETLSEYWEKLMKQADWLEKEEIKYFLHCTTLSRKEAIRKEGFLIGGLTDLPRRAPLACHPDLKGIWLALSTKDLPTRSPYGCHRMRFKVRDIISYMATTVDDRSTTRSLLDADDRWDAEVDEEPKGKGKKKKHKPKQKNNTKHVQKECYVKKGEKEKDKQRGDKPLLFFEHAHYYGTTQYVRLILMRRDDQDVDWCQDNLKEIDIHNNPFLELKWGRLYSYTIGETGKREVIVELLVKGDIVFKQLAETPTWDEVSKLERAGFDPRVGTLL